MHALPRPRAALRLGTALVLTSLILGGLVLGGLPARADDATAPLDSLPKQDRLAWFAAAKAAGHTGLAHKTRPVDARPAKEGEVIVSRIAGQGVETTSPPAKAGDWVVRNRCDASGNEEILVPAAKFPTRYGPAQGAADAQGYQEFRPSGAEMGYAVVPAEAGAFAIEAPWGELQRVLPGDVIAQVVADPNDTYRIERRAFDCTYEIITPAG